MLFLHEGTQCSQEIHTIEMMESQIGVSELKHFSHSSKGSV